MGKVKEVLLSEEDIMILNEYRADYDIIDWEIALELRYAIANNA